MERDRLQSHARPARGVRRDRPARPSGPPAGASEPGASEPGVRDAAPAPAADPAVAARAPDPGVAAPAVDGAPAEPILVAVDLHRRYGEGDVAVNALDGVSLQLPAGAFTAIMGPSGSGKSTLMHVLAGLDTPTSGTVTLAGTELAKLDDRRLTRLRREKVGFIFQTFNLLPVLTATENIELPLKIAGRPVDVAWRDQLIETVGLSGRTDHHPAELSGGEQQRVAVARALITRPAVVFADEPTGNLDSHSSAEVLALLRRSVDELGQTVVMVTHDANAAAIADRILVLVDGRIARDETIAEPQQVHRLMREVR